MMQYLTNTYLTATPHKVGLNTRETSPTSAALNRPRPHANAGNRRSSMSSNGRKLA